MSAIGPYPTFFLEAYDMLYTASFYRISICIEQWKWYFSISFRHVIDKCESIVHCLVLSIHDAAYCQLYSSSV